MKKQIICLANSYKPGGRCVAGIDVDTGNWIRPVSQETDSGAIPTEIVSNVKLLDIVEFEMVEEVPDGFQSENVHFKKDSIAVVDSVSLDEIEKYCVESGKIFGNYGKAVNEEHIENLNHSLIIVNVTDVTVNEKYYEGKAHPKIRIKFDFDGHEYDLPVTDPIFLDKYKENKNILHDKDPIYLAISLALLNGEEWHSKLIAGVLY